VRRILTFVSKRHEPVRVGLTPKLRKILFFVGCVACLLGFGTLFGGGLHYPNWYGQMVFAPYAAAIGLFAIGLAIFGQDRRDVHEPDKGHKRFR
jgi:hypothetical protein